MKSKFEKIEKSNKLYKELIRLKLTFLYDDDEISKALNEKIDYKYQLARDRKSKHNQEDIDKL